ncbi:MAG TPA: hypothetical protein VGQ09_22805 [Chitinophagaceae bacterium]|nr:hypothetical protein [Chitinophagaceae bacterium]
MKKLIFALTMLLGSATIFASTTPEVNEKVLKAFHQTFKDPKDVNWHEYDNYYEVDFKQDEIKTQVRYDAEGNITGTTRYYFESQLPPHIISSLKKKYPQRSVYGVTEIYTEGDLQYYITMQDEKNWYTVKSNPVGNLEQTEKFKKAPTK